MPVRRAMPRAVVIALVVITAFGAYQGDVAGLEAPPGLAAAAGAPAGAGQRAAANGSAGAPGEPRTEAAAVPSAEADPQQRSVRAAVDRVLREQASAVRAHDLVRYRSTILDPSGRRGRQELAVFDRMLALRVTGLSWTVRSLSPVDAAHDTWRITVSGSYRVRGVDRGPRRFTRLIEVGRSADGWRVIGRASPRQGTPAASPPIEPWDLTGAHVVWTRSGPVVGTVPDSQLRAAGRMLVAGSRAVAGLCGAPRPNVVLVVPATVDQLHALVGGVDVSQVAAVTIGDVAPGHVAEADRVVVNPLAFAEITPTGRQVVLTHELTHVALRGSVPGSPATWLAEGLADTMGYAASGLSPQQVAGSLLDAVRAGRGPTSLPPDNAFSGGATNIDLSYQGAYLAVQLLRDRAGPAGVCRLYRAEASAGPGVAGRAEAWHSALGMSRADFTAAWIRRLHTLAGA